MTFQRAINRAAAVTVGPLGAAVRGEPTRLDLVTELTERAVASRVPSLADEKLKMLSRRDPLTVRPGTSLQECLSRIQEAGTEAARPRLGRPSDRECSTRGAPRLIARCKVSRAVSGVR